MRKLVSVFTLIITVSFVLSGCNVYRDLFRTNNCSDCPLYHYKSEWVCENPEITFNVHGEPQNDGSFYWPSGVIKYQGKEYYFSLEFDYLRTIYFVPCEKDELKIRHYCTPEEFYFKGICVYSKDSFTVEIDKETDNVFDGEFDAILFTKVIPDMNK